MVFAITYFVKALPATVAKSDSTGGINRGKIAPPF